jgi:hypothetical protein
MMNASQEEKSLVKQELPEVVFRKPEIIIPVKAAVIDVPKTQTPSYKATKDSSFIHHAQIESMMNSKRSVSHALSRRIISAESRRPTSSMAAESSDSSISKSKRYFNW